MTKHCPVSSSFRPSVPSTVEILESRTLFSGPGAIAIQAELLPAVPIESVATVSPAQIKPYRQFTGLGYGIGALSFDNNGDVRAVGSGTSGNHARKWNLASSQSLKTVGDQPGYELTSPNGQWLYIPGALISQVTGQRIALDPGSTADRAVFSADSSRIAVKGPGGNVRIRVYRTSDGKKLLDAQPSFNATATVDLSPDGHCVAIAGGRSSAPVSLGIAVWNVDTKVQTPHLPWHGGAKILVRFSQDGKQLCALHWDSGLITVFDTATGKSIRSFTAGGPVIAGSGQIVATASGFIVAYTNNNQKTVTIWNASQGKLIGTVPKTALYLLSPDGQKFLTVQKDNTIAVWSASTSKELEVLTGDTGALNAIAFSPDSKFVGGGGADKVLRVWRVA